jgi:hypothetical protein
MKGGAMALEVYTLRQSRLDRAFSRGGCCAALTCHCGRTYFVTSEGHGDYGEGELEELRRNAEKEPDKYIEVPDFSCVANLYIDGKELVIGCKCGGADRYAEWIESHAVELTEYLKLYWEDQYREAEEERLQAEKMLNLLKKGEEVRC